MMIMTVGSNTVRVYGYAHASCEVFVYHGVILGITNESESRREDNVPRLQVIDHFDRYVTPEYDRRAGPFFLLSIGDPFHFL